MDYTLIAVVLAFVILISIQYTLNKILLEIRRLRKAMEEERSLEYRRERY